ncbi:hypothetical protein [Verrucomicrobium spinosum]|uniref:hypothetical protein n=1 Tax=Verrucomicrobium spinosum TaxID=2736 RepID=UPI0009467383|nr:hypothetical protein [Verrucomicrobium spinosum]
MIIAPRQKDAHLASTWMAGVALVLLGIGGYGASLPLLPKMEDMPMVMEMGDEIPLEDSTHLQRPPQKHRLRSQR